MHRRSFIAAVLAGLTFVQVGRAQTRPLSLGIMPFNSPLTLIKIHQSLREHLQNRLGQAVDIYTSADFFTFVNDIAEGRFDIVITAPHFALPARERGYLPLVRYQADLDFVVLQPAGQNWTPADLKGRRLGVPSRLTIAAIAGVEWLREQGLKLGPDYSLREYSTHGAAIAGLAVGDVDAAVVSRFALRQNPEDIQQRVKVMASVLRVPHMMTLAHRRIGASRLDALRAALLDFAQTPAGAAFFKETGYQNFVPVGADDLARLAPYWETARQLMGWRQ